MYYPELLSLSSEFNTDLLNNFDDFLYAAYESEIISASKLSIRFETDFNCIVNLLDKSCELALLEKKFAIVCPECGHTIDIVKMDKLYARINDIDSCSACNNDNFNLATEDIQVAYCKKKILITNRKMFMMV